MNDELAVSVWDLNKCYNGTRALKDVNFDVYRGEVFSLVGPNGAGKTTTVEILECLRQPDSGEANVLDMIFTKMRKKSSKILVLCPKISQPLIG